MSDHSTEDPALTAARSRDLFALAAELDGRDVPVSVLAELAADDALGDMLVAHLQRRVRAASRETLAALGAVVVRVATDGPERQLALAELWRQVRPSMPERALPAWRAFGGPEAVAIAWLRTELASDATAVSREPMGARLLLSLGGPSLPQWLRDLADPVAHLGALARRDEAPLQSLALAWTREALYAALISAPAAQRIFVDLAHSKVDAVAADALAELTRPWAVLLPYEGLGKLLSSRDLPQLAARWGLTGPLRSAIDRPRHLPAVRQRAMELLGPIAERHEIGAVVEAAAADPALFALPLMSFLRAQHRRGNFLRPADVSALLGMVVAHSGVDARDVAVVAFPVRFTVVTQLESADADDPSWVRRAALLVALAQGPQGAATLPVGEVLRAKLAATRDPVVRRALIHGLGALRDEGSEAAVLAWLETEPDAALDALRALGSDATLAALLRAFDVASDEPAIAPALRDHRDAAVTLAWHLSELHPSVRTRLRRSFERQPVPREVLRSLGTRGAAEEIALLQRMASDATTSDYLQRLAAVAGPAELDAVSDLLMRLVSDLDAGDAANPGGRGDEARSVPRADRDALAAMGTRLFRAGSIRPRSLLDASDSTAGELMVSGLARGLLARDDLTEGETAALLKLLSPRCDREVFPLLTAMLRRPEAQVRKVVVSLLAQDGADVLAANLARLTAEDDIQTVRQAVEALGALDGDAQADVLARALDHPNMNIKKSAAEALVRGGNADAVPRLLYWLGTHDNPGFRTSLRRALEAILGEAYAATVLVALAADGVDAGRRARFIEALPDGVARRFVEVSSVGAAEAPTRRSTPTAAERQVERARRFEADGFRPDEARALLAEAGEQGWSAAASRPLRRLWTEWLPFTRDPDARVRASVWWLLAQLAEISPPGPAEALALGRHLDALLDALAAGDPRYDLRALLAQVVPTLPVPLRRATADALRALPDRPDLAGGDAFALLRACGALLTHFDVAKALRETRRTADPAARQRRVLDAAFPGHADAPSLPADARTALDEAVRRERDLDALRRAWDAPPAATVRALVEVFPSSRDLHHAALLDWLESLRPVGVAGWVHPAPPAAPKIDRRRPDDLSAPPSMALHTRLVDMLAGPDASARSRAAEALLRWPLDEAPRVLAAYLRGDVTLAPSAALAAPLAHATDDAIRAYIDDPSAGPRVLALLPYLGRATLTAWAPALLLDLENVADPATKRRVEAAVRVAVGGSPVPQPERQPTTSFAVGLAEKRERHIAPGARPDREALFASAAGDDVEAARRALTLLAERPDARLVALLDRYVDAPSSRLRLHAHRLLRGCVSREAYLEITARLLDDPLADVRRTAVRVLSFARYAPSIERLVDMLADANPVVRRAVEEGVARFGNGALGPLRAAASHARPDRRAVYERALARLDAEAD